VIADQRVISPAAVGIVPSLAMVFAKITTRCGIRGQAEHSVAASLLFALSLWGPRQYVRVALPTLDGRVPGFRKGVRSAERAGLRPGRAP
jgi:hypothetical protein